MMGALQRLLEGIFNFGEGKVANYSSYPSSKEMPSRKQRKVVRNNTFQTNYRIKRRKAAK